MMISLILPIVFFGMLVLLYPMAAMALSLSSWMLKKYAGDRVIKGKGIGGTIDKKTDDAKDITFLVLVLLIFFLLSPLAVFFLVGLI